MKAVRSMLGTAVAIMAAVVVMYIVSFWTGEVLGGPIYSARLALILILLYVLILLVPRLGRGRARCARSVWGKRGSSCTACGG